MLGQNGVFDDELEQTGDVMGVEVVRFAKLNQAFQQVAFTVDITDRPMGVQLGFSHFDGECATFCQQGQ